MLLQGVNWVWNAVHEWTIECRQKCTHLPLDTATTMQFGWSLFRGNTVHVCKPTPTFALIE